MRIKPVHFLNGGEVLAEPVLTEEKSVLLPKGTSLKKDYLSLIQSLGVETLMIEDPFEIYENPNHIINRRNLEAYVERIRKLLENHIYHGKTAWYEFEIMANEIVKEINELPDDVVIDMNERTANLYEHTVMVTLLSVMIAKKLRLDRKKQYQVALGGLLHDLGIRYITVPYENCNPEEGDPVKVFEYKKHTIMGYSALDEENWIPEISRKMVLSHHEKINGTGFPMKQKTREVECKIIQACDTFDCYISGMECKRVTVQEALEKIQAESGNLFDEKIVKNLVSMIAKYPVGTTVKTTEEENGVVISQTIDPENPIIMILDANMNFDCEEKRQNLMMEKDISILSIV